MLPVGRNKTAFTLIELLLALAIIGILLGISFPLLKKNISNTQFRAIVNKVYLLLDYAKTHSTLKNITVKLISDDQSKLWLVEGSDSEKKINEIEIPEKTKIEFSQEAIIFYPDGSMQEFEIAISDKDRREAKIWSKGIDGKIIVNQDEK